MVRAERDGVGGERHLGLRPRQLVRPLQVAGLGALTPKMFWNVGTPKMLKCWDPPKKSKTCFGRVDPQNNLRHQVQQQWTQQEIEQWEQEREQEQEQRETEQWVQEQAEAESRPGHA